MKVNGYVEWLDGSLMSAEWERCAEFRYSDDAIAFAKSQAKTSPQHFFRAVRCHADDQYGSNGIVWKSGVGYISDKFAFPPSV